MAEIRPFQTDDLEQLYRIALATGAQGCDASALYRDPKLVGHVYAAPYALFSPETVFVVEDSGGVAGYIVGPANTPDFDDRLEAEWWPRLRSAYANPAGIPRKSWSRDQLMCHLIHRPFRAPSELTGPFPAHLHINLLPRLRGRGFGRRLTDRWLGVICSNGAKGAHLSTGATNTRAVRFYRAYGFRLLPFSESSFAGALWFGFDCKSASDDTSGEKLTERRP